MKVKVYNKHVRDCILEIIEALEKTCATEILSDGVYIEELGQVRADKAAKRGGFEKKILLKQVEEA